MPSTATDRIDGLTTSVAVKAPCKAVSTANLTLSGEQTVNGVALVDGDRCLVKDQTSGVNNGIYVVRTTAWERAKDFDGTRDVVTGTQVLVVSGSGTGSWYRVTTTGTITPGTTAITFVESVFGDATTVNFLQAGTGAVTRTMQAKGRERISVLDFGATGDGTTDDTTAFTNALVSAAGKSLYVPDPATSYRITTTLSPAANTRIYGDGKASTRIKLDAATTLIELASGCVLEGLYLDGNQKVGKGVNLAAGTSLQSINECKIIDFDDTCINFADTTSGSGFRCLNTLAYRYNAATGSGKYAVVIEDAVEAAAYPRHFTGFETGGAPSISFGGATSTYINGGFLSDILYSANTRVACIDNARIANAAGITILGGQNTIVGGDIYPQVTLGAGADGCVIGPCAYNTLPVIDNSAAAGNLIYHTSIAYTPTWTGGSPTIGNGSLTGQWSRQGNTIHVSITLVIGGTTNLGAGEWSFSLPLATRISTVPQVGPMWGVIALASYFSGAAVLLPSGSTVKCYMGGGIPPASYVTAACGSATPTFDPGGTPRTWVSGDFMRLSISYQVG